MKPPRHLYDPKFRYVSAAATDVARTFEKHRRLQRLQQSKTTTVIQLPAKKVSA
jgi:hypothetical protein